MKDPEGDSIVASDFDPETAGIVKELGALHKGRGIWSPDLRRKCGPRLRELAGDAATAVEFRSNLAAALNQCASRIPEDGEKMRTAALAGLGLAPDTRHMTDFGDRASWLAAKIDRHVRTALRRIDGAEMLLAEEIVRELGRLHGRAPNAGIGWYLDEFRTTLRLDGKVPEAYETRRIVAVRPCLSDVVVSVDVPGSDADASLRPEADIVFGGTLARVERPLPARTQFVIRLPVPLQPGETHDFAIIVRVRELRRPHYIFTPEQDCNYFDLRVRFSPRRRPAWIRVVDGETVRMFDSPRPGVEAVPVDSSGEAHVSFVKPCLYLGYGLQWQPR